MWGWARLPVLGNFVVLIICQLVMQNSTDDVKSNNDELNNNLSKAALSNTFDAYSHDVRK